MLIRYYQPHSQIDTSHESRYTNIATLNCTKFKTKMAYLQLSKVQYMVLGRYYCIEAKRSKRLKFSLHPYKHGYLI